MKERKSNVRHIARSGTYSLSWLVSPWLLVSNAQNTHSISSTYIHHDLPFLFSFLSFSSFLFSHYFPLPLLTKLQSPVSNRKLRDPLSSISSLPPEPWLLPGSTLIESSISSFLQPLLLNQLRSLLSHVRFLSLGPCPSRSSSVCRFVSPLSIWHLIQTWSP